MKYLVLLCDGMADTPVPELDGKTPMEAAHKPNMDALAKESFVGLAKTVPDGMKPAVTWPIFPPWATIPPIVTPAVPHWRRHLSAST